MVHSCGVYSLLFLLLGAVSVYSLNAYDDYQLPDFVANALYSCCRLTSDHAAMMTCANYTAVLAAEPFEASIPPADQINTRIGMDGLGSVMKTLLKRKLTAAAASALEQRLQRGNQLRVGIISYANADIADYAASSALINAAWAKARGYAFTLADARYSAYEPHDSRWNKVKIVEQALSAALEGTAGNASTSSVPGWGAGLDYILWLDSDLVILDFNFDVEKDILHGGTACIETGICDVVNLQADLIACRDPRPENGLINTGALLVKVTSASLRFFRRWWAMDRGAGMDQHAFDRLWELQLQETNTDVCSKDAIPAAKVWMLPPHYLNSRFPAWKYQQAEHAVLHLAGVSSIARRSLFEKGVTELCRAADVANSGNATDINQEQQFKPGTGTVLMRQLGMDRSAVQSVIFNTNITVNVVLSLIDDIKKAELYVHFSEKLLVLKDVHNFHSKSRDYRQAGYDSGRSSIDENDLAAVSADNKLVEATHVDCLRALYSLQRALLAAATYTASSANSAQREKPSPQYIAETLQMTLDAGFNLASSLKIPSERLEVLDGMKPALEMLKDLVGSEKQEAELNVLYFAFKFECFRAISVADTVDATASAAGITEISRESTEAEVDALGNAWAIWEKLQAGSWYGAGNQLADPGREAFEVRARYGALQCEVLGRTTLGFRALEQAVSILTSKWGSRLVLLKLPITTTKPESASHAHDILLNDIIAMKKGSKIAPADAHIPPYALSSLIGIYLASSSCAIKHLHNGDMADSDNSALPTADDAVQYVSHAFRVLKHVKTLINDRVWGYEESELQGLLDEYIPAAETVFRLVNLSARDAHTKGNGKGIKEVVTATANKKWRRRKRSSPLTK